jgi:hypothetical protein
MATEIEAEYTLKTGKPGERLRTTFGFLPRTVIGVGEDGLWHMEHDGYVAEATTMSMLVPLWLMVRSGCGTVECKSEGGYQGRAYFRGEDE